MPGPLTNHAPPAARSAGLWQPVQQIISTLVVSWWYLASRQDSGSPHLVDRAEVWLGLPASPPTLLLVPRLLPSPHPRLDKLCRPRPVPPRDERSLGVEFKALPDRLPPGHRCSGSTADAMRRQCSCPGEVLASHFILTDCLSRPHVPLVLST